MQTLNSSLSIPTILYSFWSHSFKSHLYMRSHSHNVIHQELSPKFQPQLLYFSCLIGTSMELLVHLLVYCSCSPSHLSWWQLQSSSCLYQKHWVHSWPSLSFILCPLHQEVLYPDYDPFSPLFQVMTIPCLGYWNCLLTSLLLCLLPSYCLFSIVQRKSSVKGQTHHVCLLVKALQYLPISITGKARVLSMTDKSLQDLTSGYLPDFLFYCSLPP